MRARQRERESERVRQSEREIDRDRWRMRERKGENTKRILTLRKTIPCSYSLLLFLVTMNNYNICHIAISIFLYIYVLFIDK